MKNLAGLTEKILLDSHKFQFDRSHQNPNECTLCSMSMLLEIALKVEKNELEITAVILGKELDRIPFRHPRFPANFPGPGGATHPRAALNGLKQKISSLRKAGINYPWWPHLRKNQSPNELENHLDAGKPTLIYGLGKSGIPHVVVPIGRSEKDWHILDPGKPKKLNPMIWSDEKLDQWWQVYWLFYPQGTMIFLSRDNE
jgi:hypothetical protein